MNTEIDSNHFETHVALRNRASALREMRLALEYAAQKLVEYEARYEGMEGLLDKAQVLNCAVAHVCTGVMPNARIDLAASAQAELYALGKRVFAA